MALLLKDLEELNLDQLVKSFEIYDNLINDGKTEVYAAAYFYSYWDNSHDPEDCTVYADCVNLAITNGEALEKARAFGDDMMEYWANGSFITEIDRFRKRYPESWAKDKFYELLVTSEEKSDERQMSTLLKNEFRKDLRLPPTTDSLTQEDKDYLKLKEIFESFGMEDSESDRYAYKIAYGYEEIDILPKQYLQNATLRQKLNEIFDN